MSFWTKYTKLEDLGSNSNIKNYLVRIQPIVKEINYKDKEECDSIIEKLKKFKEKLKEKLYIFEIIEENNKLYIVIDNNDELLSKIDKLILSKELDIKKESFIEGHDLITKEEIFNLFEMEKAMCRISFQTLEGKQCFGTGFFCKIDNFPIKLALFTNNHVLDETIIEIGRSFNFEFYEKSLFGSYSLVNRQIKIAGNRNIFTNAYLDYTCVELLESDGIKNFFEVEPLIYRKDKSFLENNDIFILQYPNGKDISFSYGKIKSIENNNFLEYDASTENGSSGSPIIRKCNLKYIIGIHHSSDRIKKSNYGTSFDSILNNIEENNYQIHCVYIPNQKKINLLHDYNENLDERGKEYINNYLEAKNLNKKLFQENVDIFINDKKINFNFTYNIKDQDVLFLVKDNSFPHSSVIYLNAIKVTFKFKKLLTNMSHMFSGCSSLKSVDLSSFNTNNINNMSFVFDGCEALESINLSSLNTNNVKKMWGMFYDCQSLKSINLLNFNLDNVTDIGSMFWSCISLKSIDLSSFKTNKVNEMHHLFHNCKSLKSIDLSLFTTDNVTDMSEMFSDCISLKSLDLSTFHTNNVTTMAYMFYGCKSLISVDLSSFNTNKVNNMSNMFCGCSSLKSLDLSNFNTNKVTNMIKMFCECSSLKSINLSLFNTKNVKKQFFMVSGVSLMFDSCFSLEFENIIYNKKNIKLNKEIFKAIKRNMILENEKKKEKENLEKDKIYINNNIINTNKEDDLFINNTNKDNNEENNNNKINTNKEDDLFIINANIDKNEEK